MSNKNERKQCIILVKKLGLVLSGKHILTDIDFEWSQGSLHCVIGANGSGKTSLLRTITGQYEADENSTIEINSKDIKVEEELIKKNLIYVSDDDKITLDLTGREFISFIASFYVLDVNYSARLDSLISLFDMRGDLEKSIQDYSHGMVKKISLIAYLSISKDIIILDEPFNGLDPEYSSLLSQVLISLKNAGKTIVITSHNLSLVEKIADTVTIVVAGKIKYSGSKLQLTEQIGNKTLEDSWLEIIGIQKEKDEQFTSFLQSI